MKKNLKNDYFTAKIRCFRHLAKYRNLNFAKCKYGVLDTSTKTTKQVSWVFITTFGLVPNQYTTGLVTNMLTMNDLFA